MRRRAKWSIKTLSDPDVGLINFNPQDTTVDQLRALTKPASLPPNNRIAPTEETTFRVTAQALKMKLEDDHDIHFIIADSERRDTHDDRRVPRCRQKARLSPRTRTRWQARQQFVGLFGQPSAGQLTDIAGTVVLTGVGFFDFLHGQTGVAPNGIELHPILSIALAQSPTATPTVTPTNTPAATPTPTSTATSVGFSVLTCSYVVANDETAATVSVVLTSGGHPLSGKQISWSDNAGPFVVTPPSSATNNGGEATSRDAHLGGFGIGSGTRRLRPTLL